MKMTKAQSALLWGFRAQRSRAVPFFLVTELNGTEARTMRVLEAAGMVEWRDGVEDNGETVAAWWLTPAGRAAAETVRNPND